jgi:hypothetical protein
VKMISVYIKMVGCLFFFCVPTIYEGVKNILIKVILQLNEEMVNTALIIEFVTLHR